MRARLWKVAAYALIIAGASVVSLPFLWMVSTSLKETTAVYNIPPELFPKTFLWRNYVHGWTSMDFTLHLRNTVFVTVLATFGVVASSSLVAYGFARLRAPGKGILFVILLSALMLPWQVRLIPLFVVFKNLGWVNTYLPLIVPAFFATNAFYVFLLRQFMLTIPLEMDDAARIDGCGVLQIYFRIILPMSMPALGAVVIFSFLAHWNDFLGPLIYLNDIRKWTLSLALRAFIEDAGGANTAADWPKVMAVNTAVMIPVLVIFFFAQRFFIHGITVTGVKG
jgi:ABC-type glycerol-3-phosphate transport system permease component